MNNNFTISLAQINVKIGDFENTYNKIVACVDIAKKQNADIVAFPELIISGYPPLDCLEHDTFIDNIERILDKIKALSDRIGIIVGTPIRNQSMKGKKLWNTAQFFYGNTLLHSVHKGLIPNYDVFDEYRYFEPADTFKVIDFKGQKIALTICEDLWDKSSSLEYRVQPMEELMKQNPNLIINIAASPFDYLKDFTRTSILSEKALKYNLPIFYVNNVGAQTELIFDGGSKVINSNGVVVHQMLFFSEDQQAYSLQSVQTDTQTFIQSSLSDIEKIYNAIVLGIKDYFSKSNFKTALIGLSGGVDSAIVAVLAVAALGRENVHCIYMPTQYSSQESLIDAKELSEILDISFDIISIENTYKHVLDLLSPSMKHLPSDITEENIQSRLRGLILMAHANKFGHILLNTSNKSEIATGYGTLYGDMCGALSVIGDLYKTQVYDLCHFINSKKDIIPLNIITKEPSAELKPNQKDTDSLPPYTTLDAVLFHYLEMNQDAHFISNELAVDIQEVNRIIGMVNRNEFKRFQAPPVLRISPKAFGMGRRFPIVGKY